MTRRISGYLGLGTLLAGTLVASPALAAPSWQAVKARGELRVGIDPNVGLPYAGKDGAAIKGFEAAVVRALGRTARLRVQLVETPWSTLLTSVKNGSIDAAVGSLEVSPQAGIRFLTPYYVASQSMLVNGRDTRIQRLADLKGTRVATTRGTTAALVLSQLNPAPAHIEAYPDVTAPFRALLAGQAQVVMLESAVVLHEARRLGNRVRLAGTPILPRPCAMAISAAASGFEGPLNTAFGRLRQTGELRRILTTHGVWDPAQTHPVSATTHR